MAGGARRRRGHRHGRRGRPATAGSFLTQDSEHPGRDFLAGSPDRRRRLGPGDRGGRDRRPARRPGRLGTGRRGRAGRHRLPADAGGRDQRGAYRRALTSADEATAVTNLFTGRPARGIVNRLMAELGPLSDLPPPFPTAGGAVAPLRKAPRQGTRRLARRGRPGLPPGAADVLRRADARLAGVA
ncbi:hypothetical protein ACRAWD_28465 [Caulobacter segnis]